MALFRASTVLVLIVMLSLLASCSSPGGSNLITTPEVSVTSLADGQVITGSRTVSVAGTIADSSDITAVTVTLNGSSVAGVTFDQPSFSAEVTLADNENIVEVTATNESANSDTVPLTLSYPFLAFTDFQAANLVIGQENFQDTGFGSDEDNFTSPYGNALVHQGLVYLPDYGNNRVLGYTAVPSANGAAADFVLGQTDFVSNVSGAGAAQMSGPQSAVTAEGRLFVADYSNNRILVWNSLPTTTAASADLVVGQPGFDVSAGACTQDGLASPESVFVVGDRLLVADSGNNRVLVWNELPTTSGEPADLVLGQSDFTKCAANDVLQSGGSEENPSGNTLNDPGDIWSDGSRLIVADSLNNRVLIWNSFPTDNFAPADLVLGQPDMTSNTSAAGATGLNYPYFLSSNGNQLFVVDANNNRVLIWDGIPALSAAQADRVLGQADFDNVAFNDDNQNSTSEETTASARVFWIPDGVHLFEESLIVTDNGNSRYLIFDLE
jgi:hypothetical protein